MNPVLKALRNAGYKGSATDAAAIRAFLAENPMVFEVGGKSLSTDETVAEAVKAVKVTIEAESDEDSEADVDAGAKATDGESGGFQSRTSKTATKAAGSSVERQIASPFSAGIQDRRNKKSAYVSRMKRFGVGGGDNQVAFDDADRAEVFGAFARLTIAGTRNYPEKANDQEIVQKTQITTTFTASGALVPDDFSPELIEIVLSYGVARQLCGVTKMNRDVLELPRLTSDPVAYWTGEAAAITASDPGFDRVRLVAQELASLHQMSAQLLNDSAVDAASTLARGIGRAHAYKEDLAYFLGDGTSTYGGNVGFQGKFSSNTTNIEDNAGLVQAAGDVWSEITTANIDAVFARVYEWAGMRDPKIVCNPRFFWQILVPLLDRGELTTTGRNGGSNMSDRAGAPQMSFRGYPVVFSNVMPALSADGITTARDKIQMLVGDFALASKLGEVSGGMEIATSDQYAFNQNVVTVRSINRVAINVHDIGDTSNPGPVVGLVMKDS